MKNNHSRMNKDYCFGWQEKSSALIGIGHQKAFAGNHNEIFAPKFEDYFVFWKAGQSHGYFSEETIEIWKRESRKFGEKEYLKKCRGFAE